MQTSEANLTSTRKESAPSSKEMMEMLEQQDQVISTLQEQNERLRKEQKESMSLVESYRNQLSDWEQQSNNQQKQLNDYLFSDKGMLQKEITKLRKELEKAEADNFCEMIQRRYAEELADRWQHIAERAESRKGV